MPCTRNAFFQAGRIWRGNNPNQKQEEKVKLRVLEQCVKMSFVCHVSLLVEKLHPAPSRVGLGRAPTPTSCGHGTLSLGRVWLLQPAERGPTEHLEEPQKGLEKLNEEKRPGVTDRINQTPGEG